jgi:hypothetical protein
MSIVGSIGLPSNGGGNSFSLFRKSTDSSQAIFATTTARDTYFTANADDLTFLNDHEFKLIRVDDDGSGNVVYQQRINNTWSNVVGVIKGIDGDDGLDGLDLNFSDATARDNFFSANKNKIRVNMPIMVSDSNGSVITQYWKGEANPATYSNLLWYNASIEAGNASFNLNKAQTISSGGQQVYTKNNVTDISYAPVWHGYGDHSQADSRVIYRAVERVAGDYDDNNEILGAALTTGAVGYNVNVTLANNIVLFGIDLVIAEACNDTLVYRLSSGGTEIFIQEIDVNVSAGDTISIWFDQPYDGKAGDIASATLRKKDGTLVTVRPSTDEPTVAYRKYKSRPFTDERIALLKEIGTYQVPSITSFSISGQHTQVDAGTALSGSKTFIFDVENPSNIEGTLTLKQGNSDLLTGISPTATSTSAAITSVTLGSGQSVTFTLEGVSTNGSTVSKSFTVRARVQSEALYYGVVTDITPTNINESSLTEYDVTAGTSFDASFVIPSNDYAVILSPADREITSITDTTFNQAILADFTKTDNAKTINSQQYDLYTHRNQASVQGTLNTNIRIG